MNRREYIRATVSGVSAIGVAGCLGFGGEEHPDPNTDIQPDPSIYSDEPVSDEVAESTSKIADAEDVLDRAFGSLESTVNEFSGVVMSPDDRLSPSSGQEQLTDVPPLLEEAEQGAVESQERFIAGVRKVTSSLEEAVIVLEELTKATESYNEWDAAIRDTDISGAEDALNSFDERTTTAFDRLDDVQDPLNEVDKAVLEESAVLTEGRMNRFIAELNGIVTLFTVLQGGMSDVIDAVDPVLSAASDIDRSDTPAAIASLETAQASFKEASERLSEEEDQILQHYKPDVQALTCAVNSTQGASEGFIDLLEEYDSLEPTEQVTHVMDVKEELQSCSYDLLTGVFNPFVQYFLD